MFPSYLSSLLPNMYFTLGVTLPLLISSSPFSGHLRLPHCPSRAQLPSILILSALSLHLFPSYLSPLIPNMYFTLRVTLPLLLSSSPFSRHLRLPHCPSRAQLPFTWPLPYSNSLLINDTKPLRQTLLPWYNLLPFLMMLFKGC